MIGKFINKRYQIETLLGRGGMGSVYRAADLVQNRLVALKFLDLYRGSQTEMTLTRFQREFRVLTRLNHPRIVQAYEFGTYDGTPYLVLEYLAGVTLADEIANIPLPRARSLLIARQICEPLAYLHRQAIVHRDLKPDNLMLMSAADDTVGSGVKLMDFGLVHQADLSLQLTEEGLVLGTVAYMAPEQAQGFLVDFRADLYALGAILYQMVTGRPPFTPNNPAAMLMQLLTSLPPAPHQLNPAVDEPLEQLIMHLLAKEPSERPPNVEGVAAQLAQLADETVPTLSPATATALDPHRIDLIPRVPLIGRETALTELLQYWTTARSGQGQVVLLSGLAGVGKTRLLDEAKPRVQLEQGWIVRSHCQDQAALPYQPVLNILEALLQHLPAAVRENLPPELTRLLPGAGNYSFSNPDSTDQAEARRRLFTACWEVIRQAAQKQALQIVLEDLQWLDPASQELLDYLIEQAGLTHLLLILTYRSEEFDPTTTLASLRRGLGHQPIAHTIELKLLTREQVARFLQNALSWKDAPAWLIDKFYQATDGNPLFIEETLKALAAEGQVAEWIRQGSSQSRKASLSDVGLQLPQNVLDLAKRRLQLLTDEDRSILTTAAVLGPEFPFALLATVTKLAEDDLLDAVDRLLGARFIEELPLQAGEDRYRFAQEALRQALLTMMSQRRLRTLHRRAGEAIERVYTDVQPRTWPVLAHHFGQAGDDQKTIKYSILAGDAAADIFANVEAIGYYRQALALLEPTASSDQPLAHLYTRLGRTLELNAQFDEALVTYQEMERVAQRVHDRKMLLTALSAQAALRVLPTNQYDAEQGELLLKKALELTQELADQVGEVRTLWTLFHVYRLTNRLKAIEVGERALVLARKNNLREQMAFILNDLGRCYLVSCYLNQAKETIPEAIPLWRELHNLPMLTDSLSTIGQTLYYMGEYEQAISWMQEALQISRSIANVWGQAFSQVALGRVYWEQGLPTQAIAVMKESIQLGVSIDYIGPQVVTQADLAIVYGSLGAIEQGLESARLAVMAASKVRALGFYALAALASIHLLVGNLVEAATIVDQGKSDPSRDAAPVHFISLTMVEAELRLKQGNAQQAIEVTNALITNFRQSGIRTYLPDCLYVQGRALLTLGQPEAAYACFLEARAIAEAIGLRRMLWPILFALSRLEPNPTEAERLHQQAREIVAYIADHTPADLRDSFLALPEVQAVK